MNRNLIIGALALSGVCLAFGFVNGWLWGWGACCGILGQIALTQITERLKEAEKDLNEITPSDPRDK